MLLFQRFAASSDNPVVALRWLETAAIQAAAESGMADNRTVSVVVKGTMKPQIEQVSLPKVTDGIVRPNTRL